MAGGHLVVTAERVAFRPNPLEAARQEASWEVDPSAVRAVQVHRRPGRLAGRFPWLEVVTDHGTEAFRGRRISVVADAVATAAGRPVETVNVGTASDGEDGDLWASRWTIAAAACILAFVPVALVGLLLHAGSAPWRAAGDAAMATGLMLLVVGSILAALSAHTWRQRPTVGTGSRGA